MINGLLYFFFSLKIVIESMILLGCDLSALSQLDSIIIGLDIPCCIYGCVFMELSITPWSNCM